MVNINLTQEELDLRIEEIKTLKRAKQVLRMNHALILSLERYIKTLENLVTKLCEGKENKNENK